jgi:hypothetical protein
MEVLLSKPIFSINVLGFYFNDVAGCNVVTLQIVDSLGNKQQSFEWSEKDTLQLGDGKTGHTIGFKRPIITLNNPNIHDVDAKVMS